MADEQHDASEQTEDPTPKRLEEAIRRGDVVKSVEVNTWFMIAGGTLMIMVFAGPMATSLQATLAGVLAKSYQLPTDGPALAALAKTLAMEVAAAFGIPLMLLCVAALAGNVVQHRIVFSTEALRPQLSRISPAAGAARLFSRQALANFAKGLAKLCLVGGVMASLLWPQRHFLSGLVSTDPAMILPFTSVLTLKMLGTVVAILAIIATADYLFQYRQWFERQKMSLREMKEEFRQTEGDPIVKGKLKQLRNTRMRKRIMAAVPKASVVITNPDPFRRGAQIRARDERADLRRQGRRPDRPQDPRSGGGARHSRGRKPAARPRAARHRRDRPGNPCGTLPRRRRNHRLHHADAPPGDPAASAVKCRAKPLAYPPRTRHESKSFPLIPAKAGIRLSAESWVSGSAGTGGWR